MVLNATLASVKIRVIRAIRVQKNSLRSRPKTMLWPKITPDARCKRAETGCRSETWHQRETNKKGKAELHPTLPFYLQFS
jgi:hypothetical protein